MGYTDNMSPEMKQRIVQELVPGKQISLAHIIANPDKILYTKLGLERKADFRYGMDVLYTEWCEYCHAGGSISGHWDHDCKSGRNCYHYGRYCDEIIWH